MRELLKKLYRIAGKESQKLSRMIVFEIVKSIFEGISLGAILFLLLKIFEKLFEQKEVVMNDVYIVFGIAVLSVAGKIVFGYLADRNKYIATYNLGAFKSKVIAYIFFISFFVFYHHFLYFIIISFYFQ